MFNAVQLTDVATGGLDRGLDALVDSLRSRAEATRVEKAERQSASAEAWEEYAHSLERQNAALAIRVALLERDYAKVESKLNSVQSTFSNYNALLVARIRKLDDVLQRQSANEFAYNKMRCKLVEKLQELADPTAVSLVSEEAQMKALKEDWDYFMEHEDVRMGVPDVKEAMRP